VAETIETTIERVFDPEAGSNRPYNIMADDKRFSTFKDDLAKIAKENQGRRGKLTFTVSTSTKGGETYTNYRFEGFEPIETLDEELTDRVNGAAPNYRQPTHPRDQASMRRALALQRANEMLAYLPEVDRTMSSVRALFKEYLAILEDDA
jgi:hypothetical protein